MLYKETIASIFYVVTLGSIAFVISYLFREITELKSRIDDLEMQLLKLFELQVLKDKIFNSLNQINNEKD